MAGCASAAGSVGGDGVVIDSLLRLEKTRPSSQPRVCMFIDVLRKSCERER